MTKFSTNALTARFCALQGWPCDTVQSWRGNQRHDLFGLFDSVALIGGRVFFIQNCHAGSIPAHERKMAERVGFIEKLVAAGVTIECWEWKRKKAGGRLQWFWRGKTWGQKTALLPWSGPHDLYPKKSDGDDVCPEG